ncbi:hypothetical protein GOD83_21900, partial [Sinorhizobium medicae]|nr:hypothetical protein [Sinorhizobium medicae]MDX0579317.1 hypothetical protein [Sinorhizobium medicae]MDX0782955.1 hypothetical protein [Sinorhizobium medicae]
MRRSFRRCSARPRKCGKGVANPTAKPPAALCLTRLCASSSAKLGGHECWSCGLTECEFL